LGKTTSNSDYVGFGGYIGSHDRISSYYYTQYSIERLTSCEEYCDVDESIYAYGATDIFTVYFYYSSIQKSYYFQRRFWYQRAMQRENVAQLFFEVSSRGTASAYFSSKIKDPDMCLQGCRDMGYCVGQDRCQNLCNTNNTASCSGGMVTQTGRRLLGITASVSNNRPGGYVSSEVSEMECVCISGREGQLCDDDIDDCATDPCAATGTCLDDGVQPNTFVCECDAGYTGALCDEDIDDCASMPCVNGNCTDTGTESYTCDCGDSGFTGTMCESDIDDCATDPCAATGTCSDDGVEPNTFVCECDAGYTGALCADDIDDCATMPCVNGNCTDTGIESYTCDCDTGYTGELCDDDIDDCASDPCHADYSSLIPDGYTSGEIDGFELTCVDTGASTYNCTLIDNRNIASGSVSTPTLVSMLLGVATTALFCTY
jgi:hypothetical protein